MKTKLIIPWLLLSCLMVGACGPGSDAATAAGAAPKPLSQRIQEKQGYQVDAQGNWKPVNNRRSGFESQGRSAESNRQVEKKAYQTRSYEKTSWWGERNFQTQAYPLRQDADRFQQPFSRAGQSAREAGRDAGLNRVHPTNPYATRAAREAGTARLARPADAETEQRRHGVDPPEIIDWREQRQMDIQQSKSILGR